MMGTLFGRVGPSVAPLAPATLHTPGVTRLQVVNVRDYGATGTGILDDRAAITAGLADLASTGGILYFPPGIYLVSSGTDGFVVPSNVRLVGAGKNASTIRKAINVSTGLFRFVGTSTSARCQRGGLMDLRLDGTGGATTGPLVFCQYADHMNFDRVWFYQNNDVGLVLSEVWDTYFQGVEWEQCGTLSWKTGASVRILGTATGSSNEISFSQCRWEGFPGQALFLDSNGTPANAPYGIWLDQCKMEAGSTTRSAFAYVDATNDVSDVHIRDIYLALDGNGSSSQVLINWVGAHNWLLDGAHVWTNAPCGAVISLFSAAYGHAIRNVFVDAPTTKPTAIITFAGGNQKMTIGAVQYKDGTLTGIYSGATPSLTTLADYPTGTLASVTYDPTTYTQKTTTTSTMTALDATNLVATFTAPQSGTVVVRLSALAGATGAVNGYWGLLNATGGAEVGRGTAGFYSAASGGDIRASVDIRVTGLTPGTSYTYQFAHCSNTSGQTFRTTYGDTPGGNPATMVVLAA